MKVLKFEPLEVFLPEGTPEIAKFKLWVYDAAEAQVMDLESTNMTFPWLTSLPIGTYGYKVEARDATGERVGEQYTGSVEWNNTVSRSVPGGGGAIVEV